MSDRYIEVNGAPVAEPDLATWARWYESADRQVARTVRLCGEDINVSTVFLALDHNFGGTTTLLYESMVFGGPLDGDCERYATRAEALTGHAAMVARVLAAGAA